MASRSTNNNNSTSTNTNTTVSTVSTSYRRAFRNARSTLGLSQYDAARVLGLSRGQISHFESGTHTPSPLFLDRLHVLVSLSNFIETQVS